MQDPPTEIGTTRVPTARPSRRSTCTAQIALFAAPQIPIGGQCPPRTTPSSHPLRLTACPSDISLPQASSSNILASLACSILNSWTLGIRPSSAFLHVSLHSACCPIPCSQELVCVENASANGEDCACAARGIFAHRGAAIVEVVLSHVYKYLG